MTTKLKYNLIAIDFDDTIVDSDFPKIIRLRPHAKRVMERIKAEGGKIAIWTARSDLRPVVEFLDRLEVPYDHINESFTCQLEFFGCDARKIFADVYIDDRNLETREAGGIDWLKIEKMLFIDDFNLNKEINSLYRQYSV